MASSADDPSTPLRPNRSSTTAIAPAEKQTEPPSSDDQSALTAQLLLKIEQMAAQIKSLQKQQSKNPNLVFQSREYWTRPIDPSVSYPGESASTSAKRAYKQRLNSYLRKSPPIWDIASGRSPCPLGEDARAVQVLKSVLGQHWKFDCNDIANSLSLLKSTEEESYDRVVAAMEADADQPTGSWNQRNSALFSVVSDTLDISSGSSDLLLLDIVEESNGIALYTLVFERLRDVKSSDPMARAMQLKLGLQHIKYKVIPHGVSAYFAAIKAHRTKLLALPTPKRIDDWEVVAKALQELPPIHPKFEATRNLLELQRKIHDKETYTLRAPSAHYTQLDR